MGLREKFKMNPELEQKGIWLELGDMRVKLARAGGSNQKYNAAVERLAKEHKRAIDNDLMPSEKGRQLLYEIYADCVILDWNTQTGGTVTEPEWTQGIENPEGDELLPFNRANVLATLKEYPDLFAEFKQTAESLQFYRQSVLDAAAKN